jgi:hypothetical protein
MFYAEFLEILNIKTRCLDFLETRLFWEVSKLANQRVGWHLQASLLVLAKSIRRASDLSGSDTKTSFNISSKVFPSLSPS